MLVVDGDWILLAALVKQNAMVALRQQLNARGKSILCWHAAGTLPEAVLTRFAIVYPAGFRAMSLACRAHRSPAAVACVMGRRSMGKGCVGYQKKFF